ncbi:hypothetical protein V494_01724 [Pseudogymnoascus sp. VKM F-4513 (FW-928)]|nr:hypothetical protein V494_01724 [Pseudogymnoascus sp. VKM F-4513 (FW-928)]
MMSSLEHMFPRKRSMSTAFGPGNIDNNNTITPYDVDSEAPPSELFYSPGFQSMRNKGFDITNQICIALGKSRLSPVEGDNLQQLICDAKGLCKPEAPETRIVAILGDSGEGKSSLINSLLNIADLAKTGDSGGACTSVVTEYKLKTSNHTAPITIEVEYLSMEEIEDLIKEILWCYRRRHLLDAQDDDISQAERDKLERESDEAWSSLEAAFGHEDGFSKEWLTKDMSEEGLITVANQIIQWAQEINWPAGADSGKWTSTADTADECCDKTSVFMQDKFWPFTKIIRVYVEAKVLRTGIILADLPGLRDTNLARVKATQDYLQRCDHVIVATKISRAITNESVKSSITSVVSKHAGMEWDDVAGGKGMNDITEKTARRDFCGPNKRIPEEVMAKLDHDLEKAKGSADRAIAKKLKLRRRWLLIDARSAHVKEELQNAYKPKSRGGPQTDKPEIGNGVLEVFCVSNTSYEKYARKGNEEMVHASGIPRVRQHLCAITARPQEIQTMNFISWKLGSLLTSAEIRASKPTAKPMETILDENIKRTLRDAKKEVCAAVSQCQTSIMDGFQKEIFTFLGQFRAWCRNDGNHKTKLRAKTNWNAELIWKMRSEMALQWDMFQDHETPKIFAGLLQSINAPLLKLQTEMREKSFGPLLVEGIDYRLQDIKYIYDLAVENFAKEVKVISSKASVPNQSSYITTEMIPVYRSAVQEQGRGSEKRQHNIVRKRITDGTLFPNISVAMKEDVKAKTEMSFGAFQRTLEPTFARIGKDLSIAIATEKKSLDKAYEERKYEERRRAELAKTIQTLKKQQRELLGRISYN